MNDRSSRAQWQQECILVKIRKSRYAFIAAVMAVSRCQAMKQRGSSGIFVIE